MNFAKDRNALIINCVSDCECVSHCCFKKHLAGSERLNSFFILTVLSRPQSLTLLHVSEVERTLRARARERERERER